MSDIGESELPETEQSIYRYGKNLTVTYSIIGLNILVFILMALNGAGIFDTNGLVHIKWGSNFSPLTLSGDWWRLVTNIFIHFGIIHIVMNMITFYQVGSYLEPMLGKLRFAFAYLCTGVIASLTSLWWHKEGVNSAGASGAIFGMYGLFLALLITDLIPKKVRDSLLKSIGFFIIYNLAYGMKGGIDNSAHVGGLVSGFLIGCLYALMIKAETLEKKLNWVLPCIALATIGTCYSYLSVNPRPLSARADIYKELQNSSSKDADRFNDSFNQFVELQDKANAVFTDTTLNDEDRLSKLNTVSLPAWTYAENLVKGMQHMDVSEGQKRKAMDLSEYIRLRREEIIAAGKLLKHETESSDELILIRQKIDSMVSVLQ